MRLCVNSKAAHERKESVEGNKNVNTRNNKHEVGACKEYMRKMSGEK